MSDDDDALKSSISGNSQQSAAVGRSSSLSNHLNSQFYHFNHNNRFVSSPSPSSVVPHPVVHSLSESSSAVQTIMNEQLIVGLYRCPFQNIFNYTTYDLDSLLTYKHYISGWLSLLVILVGLVANSITICALLHRYMRKSSTNAYLLALAFSNLCSLSCLLLMIGARFTLVHPYR